MFFKWSTLIIFFLIISSNALYAKNLKKVTLQLSWFDQFQFAGYYIAKEKGFYEDLGLDVQIKPFAFGIDIPKEVSDLNIDFAVGRETLILEKSKEQNIVALYALFQSTPLVLLSTKESKINSISDFSGKKIMTTIDDASEVSLKSMISSHNIKLNELKFIKHSHNINDLINKKTDIISAYISKSTYELEKMGIEYNVFDPKNFDFDMYSDFLYTSDSLIKKDTNTVLNFKEASLKGWKYAYSNIEETSDLIIRKYNSEKLSKEALIYEGKELKKLSYFKTNKLGEIKKEKMRRIFDLYNVMGLTKEKVIIDDFIYYDKKLKNLKFSPKNKLYLKNKKEIRMCILPDSLPYSAEKNGKFTGFVSDYVKLIEEKIQVPITLIKTETWTESLDFIKNNKCELIPSISITKERSKYLNFTRPYIQMPFVIVTQNTKPFIDDIGTLKDKKVGIIKDYAFLIILKEKFPSIDFVEVSNTNEGLNKVLDGELFGHIDSNASSWYKLQTKFLNKLKISGNVESSQDLRMGINKDDYELLEIFEKSVLNIDEETKKSLLNKWLSVQYKKEFDTTLIWQICFIVSLVLLGLLYRQNLLRKLNKSLSSKVQAKTDELQKINNNLEIRIKKAVEENRRIDRILSEKSKKAAIGEMMENIAHQWRQPLSIITTAASGLKIKKEVNDLNDEFLVDTLNSIVRTSKNLSNTIDDFKDFFKPNDEKMDFLLNKCCNKSLNLLLPKFNSKDIHVVKNMEIISIYSFESELIQVFLSILNNAQEALITCNYDKKLVFIDIYKNNGEIIIKIKDNAGGIKKDDMPKIFEPYFTTKHKSQGTGIGLYMCEEIISKHMNGKIVVSNIEYEYEEKTYLGAEIKITLL